VLLLINIWKTNKMIIDNNNTITPPIFEGIERNIA
jgi:hypothetical protein